VTRQFLVFKESIKKENPIQYDEDKGFVIHGYFAELKLSF